MFNRILAGILSLSLLINPCFAQESATEDNWQLSADTMVWQPERKTLTFGSLQVAVWVMPQMGMTTPEPGYLLLRGSVSDLLNITNNFQARLDQVVEEERTSCDGQLVECRESCKRQQAELRLNFNAKVDEIASLNTNITALEENVLLYKILAGVGGVAALSFGIYAVAK